MINKNLDEMLARIRQEHPKTIDLGLERIQQVGQRLGLITFAVPVIVVAGTNGKGSCVACLRAIYQAAGFRVANFTSPYFHCPSEQIMLPDGPCDTQQFMQTLSYIEANKAEISLTEYEYTTLVALYLCQRATPDVVILEIGMGGRDDAVNCVDGDVAIVTTVDYDHQAFLGDSLDDIARHKAGIFRSTCPALYAESNPPATLVEYATTIQAKLSYPGQNYQYAWQADNHQWQWQHSDGTVYQQLPRPIVELSNAAVAIMAVHCLQTRLPVSAQAISNGLKHIELIGRFQHVQQQPPIIIDTAHNPQALRNLAAKLQHQYPKQTFHAIIGMLKDKDLSGLRPLLPFVSNWTILPTTGPRGQSGELVSSYLSAKTTQPVTLLTEKQASQFDPRHLNQACLIFGSFQIAAWGLSRFAI